MDKIVVWFSCGAPSAVAAKRTLEKYPEASVRIVNNPVKEESSDNWRFLLDVEKWIGCGIEESTNPKYPNYSAKEVWESRQYMSGVAGAPCTTELKKKAREIWEDENQPDWHVLGFTYDEQTRHNRFVMTERDNVLPVLIEDELTKQDCIDIVQKAGIRLPDMYELGYPNANCVGCVKATSPTYWNKVRETHPEVFEQRAQQSRKIGARLVRYKGERIFLDELPSDAKGKPLKSVSLECGIFCEED